MRNLERFFDRAVTHDHQSHAEDFILRNTHFPRDITEDGRLGKITAIKMLRQTQAAGHKRRTIFNAHLDETLHLLPMGF